DEQDGHQVEAHVEFHARVLEGLETTFVGRELLARRAARPENAAGQQQGYAHANGHGQKQQNRKVVSEHPSTLPMRRMWRLLPGRSWPSPAQRSHRFVLATSTAPRWRGAGVVAQWCRRPDSNRHDREVTAPSRQRVYQFHHFGIVIIRTRPALTSVNAGRLRRFSLFRVLLDRHVKKAV